MSLMTYSYGLSPIKDDPTFAIALGFFTGIVQLIMYVLGLGESREVIVDCADGLQFMFETGSSVKSTLLLFSITGFLMEFISFSVLKAFTTAAAITIGMTQVKVGE